MECYENALSDVDFHPKTNASRQRSAHKALLSRQLLWIKGFTDNIHMTSRYVKALMNSKKVDDIFVTFDNDIEE